MSIHRFVSHLALMSLLWVIGCVGPNPLEGWHVCRSEEFSRFDKAITDDYRSYIQKLPRKERLSVLEDNIWFFENAAGDRAVRITITLSGSVWEHILYYDQQNKRVKVTKYRSGRYRS